VMNRAAVATRQRSRRHFMVMTLSRLAVRKRMTNFLCQGPGRARRRQRRRSGTSYQGRNPANSYLNFSPSGSPTTAAPPALWGTGRSMHNMCAHRGVEQRSCRRVQRPNFTSPGRCWHFPRNLSK
jgi:hypothetical protein